MNFKGTGIFTPSFEIHLVGGSSSPRMSLKMYKVELKQFANNFFIFDNSSYSYLIIRSFYEFIY